jgi:prepilin-type N-terminal cleavage/methylation domain-containing protein
MRNPNVASAAHRLRRRGGFSLVELAMVLAIIALLVAGIMLFFSNASNAEKTNEALTEVAAFAQVTRSLYTGSGNYAGLTAIQIATSGQFPAKWTTNAATGTFSDPWGGVATIASGTINSAGDSFVITLNGVPSTACQKMSTVDMGTSLYSLTVGNTVTTTTTLLTPAQALTQCAGAKGVTMAWQMQ